MELDIELIATHILWKTYDLIVQYCPEVVANVREAHQDTKQESRIPAKPVTKKKNKPMSKNEQERKIAQLKEKVQVFKAVGSPSQEPIESVEPRTPEESSGDESSDSEEE